MSYNILNKNVQFQGSDQGTIEDIVDTHSTQTIGGNKTITHLTASTLSVSNKFGIGLTDPETSLHIKDGSAGSIATTAGALLTLESSEKPKIHFQSPNAYGGSIIFGSVTDNDEGQIDYDHGSDRFLFKTGGNTKMTILGSNVGIGTTSPSAKLHVDGDILSTGGIQGTTGTFSGAITGSSDLTVKGYVSGSSIRGDGAQLTNIPGSAIGLVSGGGIVDSSGLKLGFSGMTTETSISNTDTLFVNTGGSIKSVQAQYIAGLASQAVSSYTNQPNANALIKSTGTNKEITADTNLTFNGSLLTVVGDISGSGILRIVGDITGSNISLSNASGIAGAGLANASGQLKTNFATLSSATPDVATDSIPFIDSAGDAKCTINTFLTQIAGSGISVSGNQLTAAGSSVDIDALSALGGTGLHQTQDHFMFSDNGTEKKITFSNLEDAIFANVSSDATIAAGGALTIADNAVSLAKMAGLARGNVIVGDSSGDPSALALGTAGQLLVSDGDDLLYRTLGGDATLGADGTLTIAANAVEGSMLNSNVAGSGLDYGSNQLSVDVSDFMANGVDNRVLTATGADAMTGEANLTFNGSLLTVTGTGSLDRVVIGSTDPAESRLLISGSNTEYLFQYKQGGNGYPTMFLAGESHGTYPGLLYNRGQFLNLGAISQGNLAGNNGSNTKLTIRKTSIADNSATSIVTFTIPNANHAAGFKVFGFITTDSGSRVGTFEQGIAISRVAGSVAATAGSTRVESARANSGGSGADFTISTSLAQAGAASASNTVDYQLTIDTTDGSSTNAVIYVELLNFNDSGVTMAAS